MTRRIVVRSLILSILLVLPVAQAVAGEKAVPVYEEPMHQLVFEQDRVRVLDVQIPPGATSLYHIHGAPIFYVAIDISPIDAQPAGGDWAPTRISEWHSGQVAYDLRYAEEPFTHRVRNVGTEAFRLIGVTNSGSGTPPAGSASGSELPGKVENDVAWFRQSRVVVPAGETSGWFRSEFPMVLVQVTAGEAELISGDGEGELMTSIGSFTYVEAGRGPEIRNLGTHPVALVVIEVR